MTPKPFSPAFAKHIKLTTLPNGLRIVTDTMRHVETVAVGVWANVGARHEPAKLNGIGLVTARWVPVEKKCNDLTAKK